MIVIMVCFFKKLWSCRVDSGVIAEGLITFTVCLLLQCLAAWEEVLPSMKVADTTSLSASNKPQLHVTS